MTNNNIDVSLDYPHIISTKVFSDHRGWFYEAYNQKLFDFTFNSIQDNHSCSELKGTLRGLHLQMAPYEQAKLIRVLKGKIFDVVVDLRPESKKYLQVSTFELDSNKKDLLFVPKGFAHGFMTLEDNTEVYYKVDEIYSKEHEVTILYNDSHLKIPWPVIKEIILSEKDSKGIPLEKAIELLKVKVK